MVAEKLPGPGSVFLSVNWNFLSPVRPGDLITARVVVTEARQDKPITKLDCEIADEQGTLVLDGSAVVWTEPLD